MLAFTLRALPFRFGWRRKPRPRQELLEHVISGVVGCRPIVAVVALASQLARLRWTGRDCLRDWRRRRWHGFRLGEAPVPRWTVEPDQRMLASVGIGPRLGA